MKRNILEQQAVEQYIKSINMNNDNDIVELFTFIQIIPELEDNELADILLNLLVMNNSIEELPKSKVVYTNIEQIVNPIFCLN